MRRTPDGRVRSMGLSTVGHGMILAVREILLVSAE
jgi:hypothetical protein